MYKLLQDEESDVLLRRLKREGDRERIRFQRSRARAQDDPYTLITFYTPNTPAHSSTDSHANVRAQPTTMSNISEDHDENSYTEVDVANIPNGTEQIRGRLESESTGNKSKL